VCVCVCVYVCVYVCVCVCVCVCFSCLAQVECDTGSAIGARPAPGTYRLRTFGVSKDLFGSVRFLCGWSRTWFRNFLSLLSTEVHRLTSFFLVLSVKQFHNYEGTSSSFKLNAN
jgi:hypothetical protein